MFSERIRHFIIFRLYFIGVILVLSLIFPSWNSFAWANTDKLVITEPDRLWMIISAALVFFMQAGFLCLETGLARSKHVISISLKNIADWCIASICFYLIGFGLMFGHSWNGFFGTDLFAFTHLHQPEALSLGLIFFLFQLAFAGTATTIFSGAMAERTAFIPYILSAMVISTFIFPVFGHWVWGDLFFNTNVAWLKHLGYVDFAGASVVHVVGGTISLVGIWMVGPRLGRFDRNGRIRKFEPSNIAIAGLGVLALWLGWWGFNGGSLLQFKGEKIALIIINTNLAGATGAMAAYLHAALFQQQRDMMEKLMGGALGGLVAITALAHMVSPLGAIGTGFLAGIVHNLAYEIISRKLKLDDPIGVIPIHCVCGCLGILCVPIFGYSQMLPTGSRLAQFGIQSFGLAICLLWTMAISGVLFYFLKRFIGLRVSPLEEIQGVALVRLFPEEPPVKESELEALLHEQS
jgi:ammonium transporter, Amt family